MIKKVVFLLLLTTFACAEFKLGMPQNPVSKTFDKLVNSLEQKGILEKNNIKIVKVDMRQKDLNKIKSEIEATNLFFITGSYFTRYFYDIKPNVKTVVIGNKKIIKIPQSYNNKLVGVYRVSDMENLFDISKGKAIGVLAKKNSSFDLYRAKDLVKDAQKKKINMKYLSYSNKEDLENLFKENKDKLAFIQLWSASVSKEMLPYVVKLQYKYNLPLLGQRMSHVKSGAALGYILEYDIILPQIVNYIDKISRGIDIRDLKSQNAKHTYVVNMRTVSKMGLKLDKALIKSSKIVGFKTEKDINLEKISLQKGKFTIAIPKGKHLAYKKVIQSLALKGYIRGKNLKIVQFDIDSKGYKLPKGVDLIFSVANSIKETMQVRNKEPMIVLSISGNKVIQKLVKQDKNVISITLPDKNLQRYIRDIFPHVEKIKIIGNNKSKLPHLRKNSLPISQSEKFIISSYLFKNFDDLETELAKIDREKEIVLLMPPSLQPGDVKELVRLQNKYKLPIVSQLTSEVKKGIAISITADIDKVAKNVTSLVHQILQGVEPAECTIPKVNLEFFINLQAIKKVDLQLPQHILRKARVIIQ